jgi:hypothetical protein
LFFILEKIKIEELPVASVSKPSKDCWVSCNIWWFLGSPFNNVENCCYISKLGIWFLDNMATYQSWVFDSFENLNYEHK